MSVGTGVYGNLSLLANVLCFIPLLRLHLCYDSGPHESPIITMCKHILNAQVSIRAPCCKQWYDCAECHAEIQTHPLAKATEMAFICKKCKRAFRKDMTTYDESDEYCPHCDNHYVIEAKTPQAILGVEGEDARVDSRMLKDERVRQSKNRSLFTLDLDNLTDRLG